MVKSLEDSILVTLYDRVGDNGRGYDLDTLGYEIKEPKEEVREALMPLIDRGLVDAVPGSAALRYVLTGLGIYNTEQRGLVDGAVKGNRERAQTEIFKKLSEARYRGHQYVSKNNLVLDGPGRPFAERALRVLLAAGVVDEKPADPAKLYRFTQDGISVNGGLLSVEGLILQRVSPAEATGSGGRREPVVEPPIPRKIQRSVRIWPDDEVLKPEYEYEVALSFAGEDRNYADALAGLCKRDDISVFYDKYEQSTLWGKDLYEHLHSVYGKRARHCVMFVSKHYADKLWTTHERRAAQERAFTEKGSDYILPVRIDDTEIPGLSATTHYLSIDEGIERIYQLLLEKLGRTKP
jgi:hypothetical protein